MSSREPGKERFAPAAIRYIKLGAGGAWEGASLDGRRIDWGNAADPHELAATGNWEAAKQAYLDAGVLPSTTTAYLRELKDFYTLGSDCSGSPLRGGISGGHLQSRRWCVTATTAPTRETPIAPSLANGATPIYSAGRSPRMD